MTLLTRPALLVFLIAAMGIMSAADDASPWQRPGTTAGEQIIGPDGGKLVWVPPGEFIMGCDGDEADDDEQPAHLVKITKGFWLSACEVTNAQYRDFCQATGRQFPPASNQGDDHPVVWVNWEDATAYCRHYGLRLPTEAEWEYAAAGPAKHKYPWGDAWDEKSCCNFNNRGPGGQTFPADSFLGAVSWCGALHMTGNVWEWCADRYDESYYAVSPEADPQGPSPAAHVTFFETVSFGECRVLRGGAWSLDDPRYFRCAFRYQYHPANGTDHIGFRCAAGP